jgi:hypothetical protein
MFTPKSIEEKFRSMRIRQITEQKVDSIIAGLHATILQERSRTEEQEQQAGAGIIDHISFDISHLSFAFGQLHVWAYKDVGTRCQMRNEKCQ